MARGRALHYVGDHSRFIGGVPQMDLLPEAEDTLPLDVGEERWTFAKLVQTGEYEWAPVAEVAAAVEAAEPAESARSEKPRVPLGTKP